MIFNLNTMRAYEEAVNKGLPEDEKPKAYWTTMMRLLEYGKESHGELSEFAGMKDNAKLAPEKIRRLVDLNMRIMKYVSARDLQYLLWASVHEYEGKHAVWPLTVDEIGRYVTPQQAPGIASKLVRGHNSNSPTREEVGEASGGARAVPMATAEEPVSRPTSGGAGSTGPPASAFD